MKVNRSANSFGAVLVGPREGDGGLIVVSDVAHDLPAKVALGGEDAAGDDIALDLGEPDLDLIEPGGIGGRVMELDARVGLEE